MVKALLIVIGLVLAMAVPMALRPKTKDRKPDRPAVREKPRYTSFIGPKSMSAWFGSAADALTRLRNVRGYQVEAMANGERATLDVTARNDAHIPEVVRSLGYECVSFQRFKGVIRGPARRVTDPRELQELAGLAAQLLEADRQKQLVKPGDPSSEWEGHVHPNVELHPEDVRRADRYGANTYLCVIRFRQESFPVQRGGRQRGKRVKGAGGRIDRFDQCMGIAASLLVLNQGVAADMSR
jgi:hypothetical protein